MYIPAITNTFSAPLLSVSSRHVTDALNHTAVLHISPIEQSSLTANFHQIRTERISNKLLVIRICTYITEYISVNFSHWSYYICIFILFFIFYWKNEELTIYLSVCSKKNTWMYF